MNQLDNSEVEPVQLCWTCLWEASWCVENEGCGGISNTVGYLTRCRVEGACCLDTHLLEQVEIITASICQWPGWSTWPVHWDQLKIFDPADDKTQRLGSKAHGWRENGIDSRREGRQKKGKTYGPIPRIVFDPAATCVLPASCIVLAQRLRDLAWAASWSISSVDWHRTAILGCLVLGVIQLEPLTGSGDTRTPHNIVVIRALQLKLGVLIMLDEEEEDSPMRLPFIE